MPASAAAIERVTASAGCGAAGAMTAAAAHGFTTAATPAVVLGELDVLLGRGRGALRISRRCKHK